MLIQQHLSVQCQFIEYELEKPILFTTQSSSNSHILNETWVVLEHVLLTSWHGRGVLH